MTIEPAGGATPRFCVDAAAVEVALGAVVDAARDVTPTVSDDALRAMLERRLAGAAVPYGSPAAAAAAWSVRTGRPCPVTARWCSCGHGVALQGKPIDRCPMCGGFCEGSEWR